MHAFKMLNFVFTLISLLFHTFLNPAMVPKALAILLLISFPQSLSHDSKLPSYIQIRWHSQALCLIPSSSPQSYHFQTLVSWFCWYLSSVRPPLVPHLRWWCLPGAYLVALLYIRSMSSANLRLFSCYPCMEIPVPLSRSPSITLSRYVMKVMGDNGSPCCVPIDNVNHSPMSCPTRTTNCAFSPTTLFHNLILHSRCQIISPQFLNLASYLFAIFEG